MTCLLFTQYAYYRHTVQKQKATMSDLYGMAGHLIRRLNQISTAIFADRMQREGQDLTPVQFAALITISEHPGLDQASLAGAIAHDRATIGGVVDRLTAKGLVQRKVNEHDRRARTLNLTPRGAIVLDRVRPAVDRLQRDILQGLTPDERAQFLALLAKATDAGNGFSRAPLRRDTA